MFGAAAVDAAHSQFPTARRRRFLLRRQVARVGAVLLAGVLSISLAGQADAAPAPGPAVVSPHAMTGGTGTGGSFVPC